MKTYFLKKYYLKVQLSLGCKGKQAKKYLLDVLSRAEALLHGELVGRHA
jgi:hypothetical protein